MGGSVAPLGVPWGGLGDTLGGRGDPSEATFGEQAALQNHWFYCINGYILAVRGCLGGLGGGKVPTRKGRRQEKGAQGTREEDIGDLRAPKERPKGTQRAQEAIPLITPAPPLAEMWVLLK